MEITLITFSPAGGTLKAARIVAEAMGTVTRTIDLCDRRLTPVALSEADVALIAVPSYSGRVPALALERLRSVEGNGAKAVIATVYGNRAFEDTLVELEDAAKAQGFAVTAGVAAVAAHSVVPMIAANRPDAEDIERLTDFGSRIAQKLESGSAAAPAIPGNRPYRQAGKGPTPKTSARKCNDCGKCARECPAGAISPENPHKVDPTACIGCMRCVAKCPTNAKHLPVMVKWLVGRMLKKKCAVRREAELFL